MTAPAAHATVLVVTPDDDVASRLEQDASTGGGDVAVIVGDPTDDSTLERADLETATTDDARNSYAVLAAREATDARLVAVTEDGRTDALGRAGADVAIDADALLVDAVAGATLEGENVVRCGDGDVEMAKKGRARRDAQFVSSSAAAHSG